MNTEAMKLAFEHWWHHEGSGPRQGNDDWEEHCKRMCEIAWSNGAHKALAEQPAQQEPLRPGFAGVTLWLGDAVVTQVVTEMQIQLEREPGAALTYAAQKCLAIYAGARSNT